MTEPAAYQGPAVLSLGPERIPITVTLWPDADTESLVGGAWHGRLTGTGTGGDPWDLITRLCRLHLPDGTSGYVRLLTGDDESDDPMVSPRPIRFAGVGRPPWSNWPGSNA